MAIEIRPAPIHVPAPPHVVYDVLTDLRGYGAWSPDFKVVGRRGEVGERVMLVIRAAPGAPLMLPAKIVRADRGETFSWKGGVPGLLDARHGFTLQADGTGTLVRHWEVFTGLGAGITRPAVEKMTRMYETMNAGLRAHVEALVA